MASVRDLRSAYQSNSVATASPSRLLVMLFERLVLDAERGQAAIAAGDREEANRQLQHAQAIVTELQSTLEVDGMPAGRELMALYDYLQRRFIQANVAQDAVAAAECVRLSTDLCDTWREAALRAAAATAASA
jgi:flagellar secretion chaperone FliS